jgi:hypothetical protein
MMSDPEDACELFGRKHDAAVRTFAAAGHQAFAVKPKKQGDKAGVCGLGGEACLF